VPFFWFVVFRMIYLFKNGKKERKKEKKKTCGPEEGFFRINKRL